MEVLTPSYQFLTEFILALESGSSPREFVKKYLNENDTAWERGITQVLLLVESGSTSDVKNQNLKNPYEKSILALLESSLLGNPVLNELQSLEGDYFKAHEIQIERHLTKLPYISMIPLFLFLFPSYLLLLLGPIFINLVETLNQ